jgi:hypothetical protein
MGRRDNKTQVGERLAKQIAAQQATPMSSHVNPNNQKALRISEDRLATGTAVIDAICARIAIQNDIASILGTGRVASRGKWGLVASRLAQGLFQTS